MRRFFSIQPLKTAGQIVGVSPSETHHLRHIIRLKIGDPCLLTDGLGLEAEATITEFLEDGTSRLKVEKITKAYPAQSGIRIRVFPALTKTDKMDDLVEKAQELGVEEFWPVHAERSILSIKEDKQPKVLSRWEKKAREAAKQSGSLNLLRIEPPQSFKQTVERIPPKEPMILFHPTAKAISFKQWIQRMDRDAGILNLFFGPEGGYMEEEIEFAKTLREKTGSSCTIVSLGRTILKIDTAFVGVISAVKFLLSS